MIMIMISYCVNLCIEYNPQIYINLNAQYIIAVLFEIVLMTGIQLCVDKLHVPGLIAGSNKLMFYHLKTRRCKVLLLS